MTDTRPFADLGRIVVIIPTYNERDNLEDIVGRLRSAVPEAHVLVADDNSPDGTGRIADRLAGADPAVEVLHRSAKDGLGAAYLAGFTWAIEHDYDVIVEMDADGSHQPEQLHRLLGELRHADVVLGSRWVAGGSVVNWPRYRELISRGGSLYSRLALNVPLRDVTGGYRAFRTTALRKLDLNTVQSQGYCFQVDLAWRAVSQGLTVREVPIEFVERVRGDSKMSQAIVAEAFWRVTVWGAKDKATRARRLLASKRSASARGW